MARLCFSSKHHEQVAVGPGETFAYHCKLSVVAAGRFEAAIGLFLEDNGIREVSLTVRGVGVAPAQEPGHDPPRPPPGP